MTAENEEGWIIVHRPEADCDCWACDPREDEELVDEFEDRYDDAEEVSK